MSAQGEGGRVGNGGGLVAKTTPRSELSIADDSDENRNKVAGQREKLAGCPWP